MADQSLIEKIEVMHQKSRRTYGSISIQKELAKNGLKCGHNRVARLMREVGLSAKQCRKFKIMTTTSRLPPTCLSETLRPSDPTENGWVILPSFRPLKAGCIWR